MREKIISIISDVLKEGFKYTGEDMVEDGMLDSLEMMEIISQIEKEFSIEIDAEEIIPENFKTVETIVSLVKKTQI